MHVTQMSVHDATMDWPKDHQQRAQQLVDKYGQPQEVSTTHLTWFDNGPWKRTTLYRNEFQHDFPKPHKDYLKQAVDYKVPPEKACDITAFDGSVMFDRTAGELAARCDAEAANFLGINLADQLVTGKIDVAEARRQYGENISKMMQGQMTPLMEAFQFSLPQAGTGDPDQSTIGARM
ncbi:MAG: hypothetical protein IBX62_01215 [Coriobacteriia bacterium]|nr:hypothetical protein [Coriobacteriia bacterium]